MLEDSMNLNLFQEADGRFDLTSSVGSEFVVTGTEATGAAAGIGIAG